MNTNEALRVLGVDSSAGADALKKAYRRKAMQYHPDRNPGDAKAEAMFKRVSEAYQLLTKGSASSTAQQQRTYAETRPTYTAKANLDTVHLGPYEWQKLQAICELLNMPFNDYSRIAILNAMAGCIKTILEVACQGYETCIVSSSGRGTVYYVRKCLQNNAGTYNPTAGYSVGCMGEAIAYVRAALPYAYVDATNENAAMALRVLVPLFYDMVHAELEGNKTVSFRSARASRGFTRPVSVMLWLQFNPGKTEKDARKALHYSWRRFKGTVKNIF